MKWFEPIIIIIAISLVVIPFALEIKKWFIVRDNKKRIPYDKEKLGVSTVVKYGIHQN